jgi:hypothetical protein
MKFIKESTQGEGFRGKVMKLYPVLRVDELLANSRRRQLLERIKKHTNLDEENYGLLYQPLLDGFIEFVQALPYHPNGIPGSLMDYSLERSELALRFYNKQYAENLNPLEAYALFTVALLQDVGKVMSQQKVIMTNEKGEFFAEWLVCEGSLLNKTEFYKIRFLDQELVGLAQAVTPILARQLMPALGFTWLWDDQQIFRMWLAMLTGEGKAGWALDDLLQLINKQLEEEHNKNAIPPLEIETKEPEETKLAEEFTAWLKDQLKDEKFLNQENSLAHVLPSGDLLLEQQLFINFCENYAKRVDFIVLCKQFNYIGFTKQSGDDFKFSQYFAKTAEGMGRDKARGIGFLNSANATALSNQQKKQGLVVNKENVAYLLGKNEAPKVSKVPLKPVDTRVPASAVSLGRLAALKQPLAEKIAIQRLESTRI